MQIDIGFGDTVVPRSQIIEYPTLLDFPAPRLAGYPRETVISEKYQAMVMLGIDPRYATTQRERGAPGRGLRRPRDGRNPQADRRRLRSVAADRTRLARQPPSL